MKLDISLKLFVELKKQPTHFAISLKLFFNKTQTSFVRLNLAEISVKCSVLRTNIFLFRIKVVHTLEGTDIPGSIFSQKIEQNFHRIFVKFPPNLGKVEVGA